MEKIKAGSFNPLPIVPIVLVGANVNRKPNYLAVGNVSAVNLKPPINIVSLNKVHYTSKGIIENGTFSINIPSANQVIETDYCGLASGKTTDKSEIFTTFYGDLETAPMIEECLITCECKLVDTKEFPQCISYFGEIHQVYYDQIVFENNKFDIVKSNLFFFSALENLYRNIDESKNLGQCYKIGWEYKTVKKQKSSTLFLKGPIYVNREEFQIIGVEDISKIETRNPGAVWAKFQKLASNIPNIDQSHGLGIHITTKELIKEGKNRYIVGNEISQIEHVPDGMITERIPSQKYAVFTHIGSLLNIHETYRYINEEWLPNNPSYERVPFGAEFEWYDSRFRLDSEFSELDLYIPIQDK